MSTPSGHTPAEWAAKARLDKAAPELLAALRRIIEWQDGSSLAQGRGLPSDLIEFARSAISRAEHPDDVDQVRR